MGPASACHDRRRSVLGLTRQAASYAPLSVMSTSPTPHVHFVKTDVSSTWPDIGQLDDRDIDVAEVATRLRGGTNSWLVQTYLQLARRLRDAGVICTIGERFQPNAVNIAHRDTLSRLRFAYLDCYVIGIRADRAQIKLCDFEVLQNEIEPDSDVQIGIPLWPQPGILPRRSERGGKIECIAYFGRTGTAARWLESARFHEQIGALGARFEIRENRWYDYQDVDVILAHRLEAPVMVAHKPPSKLINAWLAHTPAMLGDEPAFVNLRRSPLDYLSISTPEDVVHSLLRFKNEPRLFVEMVRNGEVRARDYNALALRERWLDLLLNRLIPGYLAKPHAKRLSSLLALSQAFVEQKSLTRRFRRDYARQRAVIEEQQSTAQAI